MRAASGMKAAVETGELPLDVILRRMRGDVTVTELQSQAAVAAAPYCHARLAAVACVAQPPDSERDRRRDLLRSLSYQQRKEIPDILDSAKAVGGSAPQIEGEAHRDP